MSYVNLPAAVVIDACQRASKQRSQRIEREREQMIQDYRPPSYWLRRLLGLPPARLTREQIIKRLQGGPGIAGMLDGWWRPEVIGAHWVGVRERLLTMAEAAQAHGQATVTVDVEGMQALEGWI